MSVPVNPVHRLLLEDGVSFLLLEDGTSKLILDEQIALDDPLNGASVSTTTPALSFAEGSSPAIKLIQTTSGKNQDGSTTGGSTSAFTNPNNAGNTIVVGIYCDTTAANLVSVTDLAGNTYTRVTAPSSTTTAAVYVAYNVINFKGNIVTANFGFNDGGIFAYEYAGIANGSAVDMTATGTSNTTALATSASGNVSAGDLIFVAAERDWQTPDALSVGAGYGNFQTLVSNFTQGAVEDKIITTTGAQTGTMTASTGNGFSWRIALVAFRPVGYTYEVEVDTVNTFDSVQAASSPTPALAQSKSAGGGTGVTPTITFSAATTSGNLIVLWYAQANAAIPSAPTGFTPLTGATGTSKGGSLFYKIADGTETTIAGGAVGSIWEMILAEYSGVAPVSPVDVENSVATAASNPSTTPTVSPSGTGKSLLVFANYVASPVAWSGEQVNGSSTGVTEREDVAGGNSESQLSDLILSSTSGTYSATATAAVSAGLAAIAIFKAAPALPAIPLLDKTSDLNIGFVDDTTTALGDDRLLLEDGVSYLLLEDNSSKLAINYDYPSGDYVTYTVPAATLSNGVTYYWRVRQKVQNGGSYTSWSEIRSFSVSSGGAASISVTQLAGTLTFAGGTQTVASVQKVSITQSAATLTFAGGTQTIATSNFVSVSQLAGTITFAGGTQAIATTRSSSISQSAATITFTGGTQVVQSNASIAQSAATITFAGGTQLIATSNFVSVSQLAGTITFSGGTQAVATVRDVQIAQSAATVTFSGGTQAVATTQDASIAQSHATLTFSGGTQVVATVRNVSLTQIAGVITFAGGTQAAAGFTNASVAQVAANLIFAGGTQATAIRVNTNISQVAATITFMGGTPTVIFNPPPQFGFFGLIISTTDQLGTMSDNAITNIPGSDTISSIAGSDARTSPAGENSSLTIDDSTQKTILQG